MTVGELITRLGEYDRNAPIKLMSQPNCPFEYDILGVWNGKSDNDDSIYETIGDDGDEDGLDSNPKAVYIVEGDQLAYGSKRAWEEYDMGLTESFRTHDFVSDEDSPESCSVCRVMYA